MATSEEINNTFEIGDVVILKSGGPKMTVESVPHKLVDESIVVKCIYFIDGNLCKNTFALNSLKKSK